MTKGERIRQRREEMGYLQTEVAELIGVTKQTLYKYEHDIVTNIPSDKIELLAEKLEVTPHYLMGWTDNSDEALNPITELAHIINEQIKDADLANALKVYFTLSPEKKKHIIDTIYLLGREQA